MENSKKSVLISCVLGSAITWYDFFIFGIATSLVFQTLFFPGLSFLIPLLVFSVGFLIRPVGSLVYGYVGDRIGRKKVLISTLFLTGTSTMIIGLLPTYDSIGIWAPLTLILMRVVQTFALGGEWSATSVMVLENNITSNNRGFLGSLVSSGLAWGLLLSGVLFGIIGSLGQDFLMDDGWRIPFLFSSVLLVLGIYARMRVLETPEYIKIKTPESNPLISVLRIHWKTILPAIGMQQLSGTWFYGILVFGIGWLVIQLGMNRAEINLLWLYLTPMVLASILFYGWLGDRIGRKKLYLIGSALSIVLTYPIFYMLSAGMFVLPVTLGICVVSMMFWAQSSTFLTEIFPTNMRQSGSGITMSFGGLIAGIVPLIAQSLQNDGPNLFVVAHLFVILGILSLISSWFLQKVTVYAER